MEQAEDLPYWRTSQAGADSWIDKAKRCIEDAGGTILTEFYGNQAGVSAFVIGFELDGDRFKIMWPVMSSKASDAGAARRQAATMLYHDVKARCLAARVRGARVAFLADLCIGNGQTAAQLSTPELMRAIPKALMAPEGNE